MIYCSFTVHRNVAGPDSQPGKLTSGLKCKNLVFFFFVSADLDLNQGWHHITLPKNPKIYHEKTHLKFILIK